MIRGERHDGCAIVHVTGEFGGDRLLGLRLRDTIADLALPDPPNVVVDLSEVVSWDARGLGAILATAKRVFAAGGVLKIAAAPDDFSAYCAHARMPWTFHETVEAAVADFRSAR